MLRPLCVVFAAGLLAGCASSTADHRAPDTPASVPSGMGAVIGGIDPCSGLPIVGGPRYAAGTVTVLKGTVSWEPTGPGTSAAVFPATVAASQSLAENATYRFVLAPGTYVLRAGFPPPANVEPYATVTVLAGRTLHVDIPNMCK